MNNPALKTTALLLAVSSVIALSAQNKAQDYNSSRSNKTSRIHMPDGWHFGAGTGASFAVKSNEQTIFRGNSTASKMFGRYNFGNIGLGFASGIIPGTISSSTISSFLTERKLPADAIITSTKPLNTYLLFGPSFSFGKRVTINADINGGMFYNNSGALTIGQQGATRALYRFDAGSKNLFPGISGTINIAYPINKSTRFFVNTDYLQTKSAIRIFDPQRGIDIPLEQNRDVKLFTAGLGIIKSFSTTGAQRIVSPRDIASGLPTGQRIVSLRDPASGLPTGQRIVSPRDPASGLPTGQRMVSPRDPASGLPTGQRMAQANTESCGPVTVKKTNADGSVEERHFSCAADAAAFERQTQQSSFGEKVNAGLHAAGGALAQGRNLKNDNIVHRDIAARNIIAGIISWNSGSSGGIVTNQSAAVSAVGNLAGGAGGGAAAASYAATGRIINDPNGVSTTIHTRDAASGLATGRRQYQPIYFEGENNNCNNCAASAHNNPLYQDKGNTGVNPMHKSNGTGNNCTGVSGLKLYLVDISTGAAVASTTTEDCGNFWFANVPSGNYAVQVKGSFTAKKSYDLNLTSKGKYDVAGEILQADDFWTIEIITGEGSPEEAPALLKTKTKSNQSNDRLSNSGNNDQNKASINTTRSNIKHMSASIADKDGDGVSEIWIGNTVTETAQLRTSLLGGALPGGAVISAAMRPGGPIGGIIVKGGKNPGGQMRTAGTNSFGEFEFTNWEEGNYTITAELNYVIADETIVTVGDDYLGGNINTTESNLKDIPPATAKGDGRSVNNINNNMPNRISMNVTVPKQTQGATFGEKVNAGMSSPATRARNNNTVRSNRTDNAFVIADLDGDGEMESSVLNFNGEVATITIDESGSSRVVEKATSGLKDVIKTQVRMAAGSGPAKWTASDNAFTHVHGDPHVDQKDGRMIFDDGKTPPLAKERWQSTPVAIKTIGYTNGTCAVITAKPNDFSPSASISLNGLPPGEPVVRAAVWFTDNKGNTYTGETDANGRVSLNGLPPGVPMRMTMNMSCAGTDDILIIFTNDPQLGSISNVLKTKHDTVKNSINNVR